MTNATRTERRDHAIADAVQARDALRAARRQYHLALVIAAGLGIGNELLAEALSTRALYVGNAIRRHSDGTCGCDAGYPGDES